MLDVYLYGSGECDQFGPIEKFTSKIPRIVPGFNNLPTNKVYKICCGGQHTLVLTTLGEVFSWGSNDEKALGREGSSTELHKINTIKYPINNISAGDCHSVAYNTDLNLLYVWGSYRNNNGLMQKAKEFPELMDMKLFNNQKLVKVVSGSNHTIVLAGSSVWAWGNSESGQTGINPKSKKKENQFIPRKFASKNVVDIFSAANHSFLISEKDGKRILKSWGLNNWGQLGVGNRSNFWYPIEIDYFIENNIQIKSVTGGEFHSLFLTQDSQVYACGSNDEGQLGLEIVSIVNPTTVNEERPTEDKQDKNLDNQQAQSFEDRIENPKETTMNVENSNPTKDIQAETQSNKQIISDSNQHEWVFTTPVKIEFFTKDNIKINQIYSTMGFNYALDSNDNQAYSWGDGMNYVLGNKDDVEEKIPFPIPKSFFFNFKIDHFSLGSQHVAVALSDPSSNLPRSELEFDISEHLESLRTKVEERKVKTGKRKREVTGVEELEIDGFGGKRKKTKYEAPVTDRVLRSASRKPEVLKKSEAMKEEVKSKDKKERSKSVKKSKSKEKKTETKIKQAKSKKTKKGK